MVLIAFTLACQNSNISKQSKLSIPHNKQINKIQNTVDRLIQILPTSYQIDKQIKNNNIKFNPLLINPTKNIIYYQTTFQKAFNLGTYTSDLFYCTLYKQKNLQINYLGAIRKLATELNLNNIISDSVQQKFINLLAKPDSLIILYKDVYKQIITKLIRNNQTSLAAVASSGAWIEQFYITLYSVNDSSKKLISIPYQQKQYQSLQLINELLENFKEQNSLIKQLYLELSELQAIWPFSTNDLTFSDFQRLFIKVTQIRSNYISTQN